MPAVATLLVICRSSYVFVLFAAGVPLLQNLDPGRRAYAVRQVRGDDFVFFLRDGRLNHLRLTGGVVRV